jgi:hypothetical protein
MAGERFLWQGCLTKNHKDGQKFKEAYLINDHLKIGQMLGYPECCIKYFIRSFPIDPVPIWLGTEGNITGYPEANGLLRYFGPRIVGHLPCSPTCLATQKIGKVWFETMKEIDKKLAEEMYDLLASPTIWNSYHGIVEIKTRYFIGLTNGLPLLKKPRIIDWTAKIDTKK